MISLDKIVQDCKAGKTEAQKLLFRRYAPVMLGICMRYAVNEAEAEDIMQDGFVKIFLNIKSYRNEGSFEGWMKRIVINTAISYIRNNKKFRRHTSFEEIGETVKISSMDEEPENSSPFSRETLMKAIRDLPEGYRKVFNMYVLDGFTHKEIAAMLNISENTSKTQLLKARKYLKKQLNELVKSAKV